MTMQPCPTCQHPNPPEAAFCMNCGTKLTRACANCGTVLPAAARFCMNCGQPVSVRTATDEARLAQLAAATPAPLADKMHAAHVAGERKLVTALFADVVGSTALAEQMDAEEWTAIMNRAFDQLSPAIYRYEGTIARLMGDALLAFFGAPVAHEDDPVRAIRAAIDLLAAARRYAADVRRDNGIDFAMRVGLNTGPVVVGSVGSDLKYEYTAMGDAVNLAARMQSAADPDTILIAEKTYRMAAPFFEVEDRGRITVKGKAEPVQVYRVIGAREGVVQARGITGLNSPLVGRARETDALRACVDELRSGRGQIVSVTGEAGLGKSRLVAELRKSLSADGVVLIAHGLWPIAAGEPDENALRWHEGRSLSYETNTSYAPFADMFTGLFDLSADDSDAAKYEKIRSGAAALFADEAAQVAPFLASLLDVAPTGEDLDRVRYLEPPQLRERVFRAVSLLIERLAQTDPVVLVFEDVHWIDPTSLDLLEQLLPLTDRAPLLILALFRPRRQEPSWRFHEAALRDFAHRYTSIALEPLDESHSRELVANLLEIEDLPEKVRALILRKAEGNPFFVEEVIRSLLDARLVVRVNSHWRATREIENIALPDTLAGVITARLDRLDDDTKRVAQTASVIGREFQVDVLTDIHADRPVVDGALGNLQRRELIREKTVSLQRAYLFKHVLTQEAAYASMLMSQRREMHRRVAGCLERREPDRVGDIARHCVEAQEFARALPYLVEAGDRAARGYATTEAVRFYAQALEILKTVEEVRLAQRAYEGLGNARMLTGDLTGAVETYQSMLQFGEAHHDIPMQVSACNKLAVAMMWMGQMEQTEQCLRQAEELARQYEDKLGLAEMFTVRCGVCNMIGDFPGVAHYMGESIQLGRQLNIKEQMAYGLTHMANALTNMTRFDEARATTHEALQLVEEIGHLQHKAELLAYPIPLHHLLNGDLDAAHRAAEEGIDLAQKIGTGYVECIAAYMLGLTAQLCGEYEHAIAHFEQSMQAGRAGAPPFFVIYGLGGLGTVYLDISEALSERIDGYHAQAVQLLDTPVGAPAGGAAWADLGFCLLVKGDVDRASAILQKGLSTPAQQGLINRSRFLVGLAYVALARGKPDEAAQLVSEAHQYVEERAMRHLVPEMMLAEAKVSAARGEFDRALEAFAQAETAALSMTMRPMAWQARAGAAKVLTALGRAAEAEAQRRAARAMIDEIAGLFRNESLRATYLESALKKIVS